jgi:RsiW-degrading membrane proteinase PrsW (M82 family)
MLYYIERNNQKHGPYELNALKTYVEDGLILMQDKISDQKGGVNVSVRDILKSNGIKVSVKNNGNIIKQVQSFGTKLLIPKDSLSFKNLKSDKRLLIIALVGLAPAFLISFTGASVITFYAIALYFSMIGGLFYYSVFSTSQVSIKKAIGLFFLTQFGIFVLVDICKIPAIHPLYALTETNRGFLSHLIGFTFGVGVFEEFVKLLPVYILLRNSKEPLIPQTVVFYGLMSGIGFGVYEGVGYQLTVNNHLDYGSSFFMNIARLTCLPFLHSVWAGISAYFLAFSFLYPKNRQSMWFLAILIPAVLHGLYDTLGWSILGLLVSYLGVTLLVIYLKNAKDFQSKIVK